MSTNIRAVFADADIGKIATTLRRVYGGDSYSIGLTDEDRHMILSFTEAPTPEQVAANKALYYHRRKTGTQRHMHVFLDGMCAMDYRDIEIAGPTAYVVLGSPGDARKILTLLVAAFGGGFIRDEATGDEWERVGAK